MRLILLSGGSGKRLWPLSNDSRSKQFLKILQNQNTELESMVQRVWGQLQQKKLADLTCIATSKSQIDMLYSQIGYQPSYILEPSRRDTFPAIALSAVYLYDKKNVPLDEVVCVLPVDPYVDEAFFDNLHLLDSVLRDSDAEIALIGVKPTYPSEKYGYIIPKANSNKIIDTEFWHVERFVEKPKEKYAVEMISKGALWNCGVFAFRLGHLISIVEDLGLPLHYETLVERYDSLPKNSFDYEVVEKTSNIAVIQYDGEWKDLGTWNTLTEEMDSNIIGRAVMCNDTKDTHVINELDIPVTVIGASNLVVAVSSDGILVANKSESHKVKNWTSLWNGRPMFVEKRWGSYKILDHKLNDDMKEILTKKVVLEKGKNFSYHVHYKRSENWIITSGTGQVIIDGCMRDVSAGDVLQIISGSMHTILATERLEFIEVQIGTELIEEDIIRIEFEWDRIIEFNEVSGSEGTFSKKEFVR